MSSNPRWRRKLAFQLCAGAVAAGAGYYVVKKVSNSERARQLAAATVGYTTAALAMGEMVSRLTTDVNDFLAAEPDTPIPPSLRQACRLLNTPELEECAARVTSGVARGVTQAATAAMSSGDGDGDSGDGEEGDGEEGDGEGDGGGEGDGERRRRVTGAGASSSSSAEAVVNRLLDRVLDTSNWGLVSCIVSSTTRQTLEAVIDVMKEQYAAQQQPDQQGGDGSGASGGGGGGGGGAADSSSTVNDVILPWLDRQPERMLSLVASAEGKSVLLDLCSCFVSNAVGVYLEKTAGSNTFDDFFNAATRANNREVMQDIAGRVTGEAVRTVVEVVSPGMVSPGVPGAGARRAARTAAAARAGSQRRGAAAAATSERRERIVFQTPTPVPAMVGDEEGVGGGVVGEGGVAELPPERGEGEAGGSGARAGGGGGAGAGAGGGGGGGGDGEGSERGVGGVPEMNEADDDLMMTPGVGAPNGFVVSPDDTSMSDDSLFPPYDRHLAASPSSSDDTADDATAVARRGGGGGGGGTDTSAAAAAAFTTAIVNDVVPHVFRVIVAPEARQLITEVAGTCTASAVRSFVLSLRDCVFLVNGTKAGAGGGGGTRRVISFTNAALVAVFAWFVFLFLFRVVFPMLCSTIHSATGYFLVPT